MSSSLWARSFISRHCPVDVTIATSDGTECSLHSGLKGSQTLLGRLIVKDPGKCACPCLSTDAPLMWPNSWHFLILPHCHRCLAPGVTKRSGLLGIPSLPPPRWGSPLSQTRLLTSPASFRPPLPLQGRVRCLLHSSSVPLILCMSFLGKWHPLLWQLWNKHVVSHTTR